MEKEIILRNDEYRERVAIISKRELAIIEYISEGLTSNEIAQRLGITTRTIETHRTHVLKKTGYKNTVHLVASFLRKGLIK